MKIETATVQGLDDTVRLVRSQFKGHEIALPPEALREALVGVLADPSRGAVLVAYDPDPIGVAVLAYTWTLEHGGRVAWLDELFVAANHRDRGVGRAMLRRALEIAAAAGCRAVDLEVDMEHERAEHLYEREGFRRLSRHRWARLLY
jgi:ribosomal protein S18 acetylase RimI-like enzyme